LINNNRVIEFKNDYSTKFISTKILSGIPLDSILFSEYLWFPLLYMQQIEHRRPDLTLILQGEVFFPEYFEAISKERFPNIKHIDAINHNNKTGYEYFWKLAKANSVNQSLFLEPDSQFKQLFTDYITPNNLLFSFHPDTKNKITKNEIENTHIYLDNLLKYDMKFIKNTEGKSYLTSKINYIANFWSELQNEEQVLKAYDNAVKAWPQGEMINNNYGTYLMSKGHLSKALDYLKKNYEKSPNNLVVSKNLARFMFRIRDYHSSLSLLENLIKTSGKGDEDIMSLLVATYYELERYNDAEKFLDNVLEILKDKSIKSTKSINDDKKLKWVKLYKELCFEKLMM
jgi:tetratricopeptide (TPR) repeat protein